MGTCRMVPTATGVIKPTEHLHIVIVGHVDHGKSTLLGRLYADTGSLPEGKLEKVQAICRQQGKEFEFAFLFDAFRGAGARHHDRHRLHVFYLEHPAIHHYRCARAQGVSQEYDLGRRAGWRRHCC